MNSPIKNIEADIAQLSDEQQAKLAADILARLHGSTADVEDAWAREAIQRLDVINTNAAPTFDAEDVMSEARRRLRDRR